MKLFHVSVILGEVYCLDYVFSLLVTSKLEKAATYMAASYSFMLDLKIGDG